MKKNDILTLEITEINNLGYGVGKHDGMVVFVGGAVSEDVIEAKIIKVNKTWAVGRIERILTPSPYRAVDEFCREGAGCGGCQYRHVSYAHELDIKRDYVKQAFRKVGLPDVEVAPVLCAGREERYRNKAQYPFGEKIDRVSGQRRVYGGFYARKTHDIVKIEDCWLEPLVFSRIMRTVCDFVTAHGVSVYHEESGQGLLRHLYLRYGEVSGEVMVCFVINGTSLPHEEELCRLLRHEYPEISSIMVNSNTRNTNVVLGHEYRTLWGKPYLEDVLCGLRFRISPAAFYQVNHDGAELLYAQAAKLAGVDKDTTLIDLYGGIGTIGLSMASRAGRVVGVEVVEAAVACARENARINGIENASFYCADADDRQALESIVADAVTAGNKVVALIDPPRRGAGRETVDLLCRMNIERIVYVSCDPDTLARDCVAFRERGYEIGTVVPVNMFPKTGHVETVILLSRKDVHERIKFDVNVEDLY